MNKILSLALAVCLVFNINIVSFASDTEYNTQITRSGNNFVISDSGATQIGVSANNTRFFMKTISNDNIDRYTLLSKQNAIMQYLSSIGYYCSNYDDLSNELTRSLIDNNTYLVYNSSGDVVGYTFDDLEGLVYKNDYEQIEINKNGKDYIYNYLKENDITVDYVLFRFCNVAEFNSIFTSKTAIPTTTPNTFIANVKTGNTTTNNKSSCYSDIDIYNGNFYSNNSLICSKGTVNGDIVNWSELGSSVRISLFSNIDYSYKYILSTYYLDTYNYETKNALASYVNEMGSLVNTSNNDYDIPTGIYTSDSTYTMPVGVVNSNGYLKVYKDNATMIMYEQGQGNVTQSYYVTDSFNSYNTETSATTYYTKTYSDTITNNYSNVYEQTNNEYRNGLSADDINIIIQTILNNMPSGDDSGGGSSDDSGGGSSDDSGGGYSDDSGSIWERLANALADLLSAIGTIIGGILSGIVEMLGNIVSAIADIIAQIGNFPSFLQAIFPFLPEPVLNCFYLAIMIAVVGGVIKFLKG